MTAVLVEIAPGQWARTDVAPADFGRVLTALAKADAKRIRAKPQLLREAPQAVQRLTFKRELAERWESPETTMAQGYGDCDNIGRLMSALGEALGYSSEVWVGYPEGRTSGARHAIGVVGGYRGDLSGLSELWQAAKRGVSSAVPKLQEVSREVQSATAHPFWKWVLAGGASMATGVPLPLAVALMEAARE